MNELQIFAEARGQTSPAARAAYLDRVCKQVPEMRRRVERLLELEQGSDHVLDCQFDNLIELFDQSQLGDGPSSAEETSEAVLKLLEPSSHEGNLGRLGHYEVQVVLGCGGFGVVLKAYDPKLQRLVAIKVLAPALAVTSPPRKRFLREARAAAAIRHENVVHIHAIEEEPIPYIVMEFVDGKTLQQRIDDEGPFDASAVVTLGLAIADGLEAAHAHKIIHRDIKPSNILLELNPVPRVKLADFGLARAVDDANRSQSGFFAGTPMFMAPEHIRGQEVDERADLFSFGSVLYTMCTGRPPFRAPTTFAVLKRVVEDTPRPIQQLIPETPAGLIAVIERLHAKDPNQRFASIGEVKEALARCLTNPQPFPRPSSTGVSRRTRKVAVLSTAVLLLVVGTVVSLNVAGWGKWFQPQTAPQQVSDKALANSSPDRPLPVTAAAVQQSGKPQSAEQQFATVLAKLKQLNPELDEKKCSHAVDNDRVFAFGCSGKLNDVSPLRELTDLRDLALTETGTVDLSPLRGLRLTTFESINTNVLDLRPLAGMPLRRLMMWGFGGTSDSLVALQGLPLEELNCGNSDVKDLSPLRGFRLKWLCLNATDVEDLSPLAEMPLTTLVVEDCPVKDLSPIARLQLEELDIGGSPVSDISPIRNMPLKRMTIAYDPARHREILRSIPTLERINHKPVAEVLGPDAPSQ